MILIFTIHSFSLTDPTTAISFDSFLYFSFFSRVLFFTSSIFIFLSPTPLLPYLLSHLSPNPNIPLFPHHKPHHNHTLLLRKSDTLIFLLNSSLLSPLSQLFSTPRMPLRVYYSM